MPKRHLAFCFGKEGMIRPYADIFPRMVLRTALTHQNIAWDYGFTAETLDA
jgi:hypothetical protein